MQVQPMARGIQTVRLKYFSLATIGYLNEETSSSALVGSDSMLNWTDRHGAFQPTSKFGASISSFHVKSFWKRRLGQELAFALNTSGLSSNGGEENTNGDNTPGLGRTRLGRLASAGGRQLLEKLNSARKNFPMKVFLLLLGFYTANALATILGQTGDWDVLVAGVVVAAIEWIGMLMYGKSFALSSGRFQSLVVMINYWKAGVCLGLFVDAFKLGS